MDILMCYTPRKFRGEIINDIVNQIVQNQHHSNQDVRLVISEQKLSVSVSVSADISVSVSAIFEGFGIGRHFGM
jgi:hypothetical protein